jgi:hypothetical protein
MNDKIYTSTLFEMWSALDDVKGVLKKPVNQKKSIQLISKLELIQKNCKDEELAAQTVSLYGKVMSSYNKYIEEEIYSLAKMTNRSSKLRKINLLKKSNGISRENLETLSRIGKSLITKPLKIEEVPLEEVEALFDLAALIYYDKKEEAKQSYSTLSPATSRCLLKHLSTLRAPFLQNKKTTLQSLFSAAYELAGKSLNHHLSLEEIQEFFEEREKVMKDDLQDPSQPILSLRLA